MQDVQVPSVQLFVQFALNSSSHIRKVSPQIMFSQGSAGSSGSGGVSGGSDGVVLSFGRSMFSSSSCILSSMFSWFVHPDNKNIKIRGKIKSFFITYY